MVRKNKKEIDYVKYVWGLVCSLSSIDQQRNNVSLFNIIDQFNLPPAFFIEQKKQGKPLLFNFLFEIVLCWRRSLDVSFYNDEIQSDLKIKMVDPNGDVIQEILAPLQCPKNMKIFRLRITMNSGLATTPGMYAYQIEIKDHFKEDFKKVSEIPFEVVEKVV